MSPRSRAFAVLFVFVAGVCSWAVGCSDLQDDCELLVNCPSAEPPPQCGGKIYSPTCDACLQSKCCQAVADCLENNPCGTYCMFGIMPPAPECNVGQTGQYFEALTSCLRTECLAECSQPSYCHPVTHNGCFPDGSQCELVYPGIFTCVPPAGAPAQLCEACNFTNGPYCGSGLRCEITSLRCARYCCTDADCGTGRCELNQNAVFGYSTADPAEMVGLCLAAAPGTGPACDAPAAAASGGTCFQGFAP